MGMLVELGIDYLEGMKNCSLIFIVRCASLSKHFLLSAGSIDCHLSR